MTIRTRPFVWSRFIGQASRAWDGCNACTKTRTRTRTTTTAVESFATIAVPFLSRLAAWLSPHGHLTIDPRTLLHSMHHPRPRHGRFRRTLLSVCDSQCSKSVAHCNSHYAPFRIPRTTLGSLLSSRDLVESVVLRNDADPNRRFFDSCRMCHTQQGGVLAPAGWSSAPTLTRQHRSRSSEHRCIYRIGPLRGMRPAFSHPCFVDNGRATFPHQQRRHMATWLPEAMQSFTIWGGSGFLLKTLHGPEGAYLPYWACFSAINVLLRLMLFPVVIYGAQTAARFAKVVPDVQFLISVFQNDMRKMLADGEPWTKRVMLMRTNLASLGALYKLHKIHPFAVFLSPILQLPFFIYLSTDLRKISNGLDPLLAQDLVDSSIGWIPDLTEPDPWFALPVLAGFAMYSNVEVAVGTKSLAGPSAGRSNTGIFLKDVFQSFAVLMPCFTSQLPAGIQIYVVTSFIFTIGQSAALRTNSFRTLMGLPLMIRPQEQKDGEVGGRYASQFIELKKLEQKARELRGDGPVLGKGVLAMGLEVAVSGAYRASTIQGSGTSHDETSTAKLTQSSKTTVGSLARIPGAMARQSPKTSLYVPTGPFVHGVSAPAWQLQEQQRQREEEALAAAMLLEEAQANTAAMGGSQEYMTNLDDELIEKANRGELPRPIPFIKPDESTNAIPKKLNVQRLRKSRKGKKRR